MSVEVRSGAYTIDYSFGDSTGRKLVQVTAVIDGQVRATDFLGQPIEFSIERWERLRPVPASLERV